MRAYFYDDLQLWEHGLFHTFENQRGLSQTFQGVDQLRGLVLPQSPNFLASLAVHCFFGPGVGYDQASFRQALDVQDDALIAKAEQLHTVFNTDGVQSVVSVVGPPVLTSSPHGLLVGDRVFIARAGQINESTVATTPSTTSFTTDTGLVNVQPGDGVYKLVGSYLECLFEGMSKPSPSGQNGDYYADDVTYQFISAGART